LPKVSTKAGSSTILGAVLLEGGELLGPGGRAAGDAERGGHGRGARGPAKRLISIIRKKVFILIWRFGRLKSYRR